MRSREGTAGGSIIDTTSPGCSPAVGGTGAFFWGNLLALDLEKEIVCLLGTWDTGYGERVG